MAQIGNVEVVVRIVGIGTKARLRILGIVARMLRITLEPKIVATRDVRKEEAT